MFLSSELALPIYNTAYECEVFNPEIVKEYVVELLPAFVEEFIVPGAAVMEGAEVPVAT